jgi:hypothetical protein
MKISNEIGDAGSPLSHDTEAGFFDPCFLEGVDPDHDHDFTQTST